MSLGASDCLILPKHFTYSKLLTKSPIDLSYDDFGIHVFLISYDKYLEVMTKIIFMNPTLGL